MDEDYGNLAIPGETEETVNLADIIADWNSDGEGTVSSGTSGPNSPSDASETDEEDDWPDDLPGAGSPDWTDGGNHAGAVSEGGDDKSFTLKHLGEIKTVGRDEIVTLAQKGLDYERQRKRNDELSIKNRELAAETERLRTLPPDGAKLARRDTDVGEFLAEYGSLDPKAIPQEVWTAVTGGRPLLAAYQAWELKKLRSEREAVSKAAVNREKSAGSRVSAGSERYRDAITADWYAQD